MGSLMGQLVTGARSVLSCPVEPVFSSTPPTGLIVYVHPASEVGEEPFACDNVTQESHEVDFVIELPAGRRNTPWTQLWGTVDALKNWVREHRDLTGFGDGMCGGTAYNIAVPEGAGKPYLLAVLRVRYNALQIEEGY